jgi:hypothetical protein
MGGSALKKTFWFCMVSAFLILSLVRTEAVVFKPGIGVTPAEYLKWSQAKRSQYAAGFYDGLCAGPLVLYERTTYLSWFVEMPSIYPGKLESIITAYIKSNPPAS